MGGVNVYKMSIWLLSLTTTFQSWSCIGRTSIRSMCTIQLCMKNGQMSTITVLSTWESVDADWHPSWDLHPSDHKNQTNCKIMRIHGIQLVSVIKDQGNYKRKSLVKIYSHKSSTAILLSDFSSQTSFSSGNTSWGHFLIQLCLAPQLAAKAPWSDSSWPSLVAKLSKKLICSQWNSSPVEYCMIGR